MKSTLKYIITGLKTLKKSEDEEGISVAVVKTLTQPARLPRDLPTLYALSFMDDSIGALEARLT
ncbi:MAG: hypothetical protein N2595_08775 [bacterium]|nr:hypothetical protein [bacterium]